MRWTKDEEYVTIISTSEDQQGICVEGSGMLPDQLPPDCRAEISVTDVKGYLRLVRAVASWANSNGYQSTALTSQEESSRQMGS